ncbi:MAG: hypothetical protein GX579_16685 [Chloroflexi bacterium]|nr:hypothetical protein [Chloroflexota bacterium]
MVALVAGVLLALQPLLAGHLPWRGDGLLHLYRLVELEHAVAHGELYPRWLPDLGYGFGFPLFNYYGPLSYYILLLPRAVGFSAPAAAQIGYALALFGLALGMFYWGRALFGTVAGLVAAFAAAYSPYFLYDALHRGTLAELWGLAWLSLSLAALHHHANRRSRASFILLVLAYAGLFLSHNIMALVGSALLLAYTLFLLVAGSRAGRDDEGFRLRRLATHPLTGLALALGLTAFFWLPALAERDLVQIERLYGSANFFYGNHFLSVRELLAVPRPVDPVQVNPPLDFGLGIPQLLLALVAWLPWRSGTATQLSAGQRAHRVALSVAAIGLLLMVLPASRFLWERLPLLYLVLFPWRFIGPASLLAALLAGLGASRLPASAWLQMGGSLVLLAAAGLPWLFPGDVPAALGLAPADVIRFEAETGWLGTTSVGEYLPAQVETLPPPDTLLPLYEASAPDYLITRLDSAALPSTVEILEEHYGITDATITLEAASPFEARFHWYAFPGWELEANGRPQETFAAGPHGLLAAELPAGRQTITLSFGDTPVRFWSAVLSGLSLALFAAAAALGPRPRAATEPAPIRPRAVAVVVGAGLALVLLKGAVLDRQPNPFVRSGFDGQAVRDADVPLQVDFDGELLLLGYDLPEAPVPADGTVDLTLYWRALHPLSVEYSVGVHLVDELGRRYGQQDSFHPADYPTTRWLPGEYARDVHRLALAPGTPPGRYSLLVTVYDARSGRRLPVRNRPDLPPGGMFPLAEVAIEPAGEQPSVASLRIERALNWQPVASLALLGVNGPPEEVAVGGALPLTFFWEATDAPDANYRARLRLIAETGETVAAMAWTPGRESYPTSRWEAGSRLRDDRALLVPAVVAGQNNSAVESGRYRLLLELMDGEGQAAGEALELSAVTVEAPVRTFDLPIAASATSAQFGELATLAGYTLSAGEIRPGEELSLALYWRAEGTTATGYTVFVHLVGPDGEIVAQRDQPPAGGSRPTTGWLPGEIIADEYSLTVPAGAPPGLYRLRVGIYDPAAGERLPAGGTNVPAGDHFFLPQSVEVTPDG